LSIETNIEDIYYNHKETVVYGFESINLDALQAAADVILYAIRSGKTIYTAGNGASASIAAISNDISYDEVYSYQLQRLADPGDVFISISSSGNSPSVVRACEVALEKNVQVIALTGFNGGRTRELAGYPIHVDVQEYEAVEDVHQAIMHMIAKYIRYRKWK